MSIIDEVRVENFRSIRNLRLSNLSSYQPVVGVNSAGKSNLLRALKLFFTGSVDESGSPVSLNRDYSDHAPKKPRRISVGVSLVIGGTIKYTRQAAFIEHHGILDRLAIKQVWSIDSGTRVLTREVYFGKSLDALQIAESSSDIANIDAFIRAVDFRYVPNHAKPSDLIDEYVAPLRSTLIARLQNTREYKAQNVDELLGGMARVADALFKDVSRSVSAGLSDRSLQSALPENFADLAFDLAIRSVDRSGNSRAPELEGSGTQQFMFLHLLDLADRTDRGSSFGWLQGHLWAIEEPESFLHSGLRQKYASDLFEYSRDPRRQVLLTTHQEEFVRVGDSAIVARHSDAGSQFERLSAKQAISESNRLAVSTYSHPFVQNLDRPLVFFEGKFDAIYLREAYLSMGRRLRWKLADPDEFTGADMGGDAFKQYLKFNTAPLAARPDKAPVIVVRDWETTDAGQYNKSLRSHTYSKAIVMPESLVNPELGSGWRGIERYLNADFIRSIVPPEDLIVNQGTGVLDPVKSALESHKQTLARSFSIADHPSPNLVDLAEWVDSQVAKVIESIPTENFF